MSELVEVKLPDIGDFADVEVIEILVETGDVVELEQGLITLESDKASMEIPSPAAGTVANIQVKTGDRISEGSMLLTLESATGTAAQQSSAAVAATGDAASAPVKFAGDAPVAALSSRPSLASCCAAVVSCSPGHQGLAPVCPFSLDVSSAV